MRRTSRWSVMCQISCAGLSGLLAQVSRSRHEPACLIMWRDIIGAQNRSFSSSFSSLFAAGDRVTSRSARVSDGKSDQAGSRFRRSLENQRQVLWQHWLNSSHWISSPPLLSQVAFTRDASKHSLMYQEIGTSAAIPKVGKVAASSPSRV